MLRECVDPRQKKSPRLALVAHGPYIFADCEGGSEWLTRGRRFAKETGRWVFLGGGLCLKKEPPILDEKLLQKKDC